MPDIKNNAPSAPVQDNARNPVSASDCEDCADDYVIKDARKTTRRFLRSMTEQRKRLTIVIISVVCYVFFCIYAPYCSAGAVDFIWKNIQAARAAGESFDLTRETGLRQLAELLGAYFAAGLFYIIQNMLMASFAENLSLRLRTEASEKLQRLPLSYYDANQSGTLMSYITNDLDKVAEALQTGMIRLIVAVATILGAVSAMLYYNAWLTLVFLSFAAVSLAIARAVSRKTLHYASARQQAVGEMNALTEESYAGRIIIRSFNCETDSRNRFVAGSEKLASAEEKTDFFINAVNPGIRIVNRCGTVFVAVVGTGMMLHNLMSPGAFLAFFQYINMAGEPITEMSYMINAMQSSLAAVERVYALLDAEEISPDCPAPAVPARLSGNVAFSHVKFGYSPDKILMNDVSFDVKNGQKIAIVGATGAGKTTLVNLLMRFYDILSGRIAIDGADIMQMRRSDVRMQFGMVLQDTWLFEGTIAENIAYGRPDARRDEIEAAARTARADFFIRTLPGGYETVLTNDAENISIGQRQLLTIARVFLANPPMIILDEATSSVDTRTEIEIGKAMKALMKNRTSFVIAHRLQTIADADLILVMQNGNIAEQGNHAELLARRGAYADLYNSQFA